MPEVVYGISVRMGGLGMGFLLIIFLFFLYIIIYCAVKDAIDNSKVGKIIIKKYGEKEPEKTPTDEEIEKELEDEGRM